MKVASLIIILVSSRTCGKVSDYLFEIGETTDTVYDRIDNSKTKIVDEEIKNKEWYKKTLWQGC
jgi:hypothetical protein